MSPTYFEPEGPSSRRRFFLYRLV